MLNVAPAKISTVSTSRRGCITSVTSQPPDVTWNALTGQSVPHDAHGTGVGYGASSAVGRYRSVATAIAATTSRRSKPLASLPNGNERIRKTTAGSISQTETRPTLYGTLALDSESVVSDQREPTATSSSANLSVWSRASRNRPNPT